MSYYQDVYLKRLNRYGLDYQSRVQGQREREFENYLLKTVYRVDFLYDDEIHAGSLERKSQDETQTLQYLLTRIDLKIPNGTVLMLEDKNHKQTPWMVYWLEDIKASGYNRYVVLKMTHFITWLDRENNENSTWAYMYGQEDNMLKDELRSRSRSDVLYGENLKMSFFVMPTNEFLRKDDYFEVGEGALKEGFRVTGYDIQSTPGIEYVTIDPVYLFDRTPAPERKSDENEEDYYWLEKGGK